MEARTTWKEHWSNHLNELHHSQRGEGATEESSEEEDDTNFLDIYKAKLDLKGKETAHKRKITSELKNINMEANRQ